MTWKADYDFVLPSDKRLGDATGEEILAAAKFYRAGAAEAHRRAIEATQRAALGAQRRTLESFRQSPGKPRR